uniref:Uncharacterized protein n=1 Tax=Lepeophtheirus salmonis TaxID=72036 RepID=A0A0K2UTN7_LEPSM
MMTSNLVVLKIIPDSIDLGIAMIFRYFNRSLQNLRGFLYLFLTHKYYTVPSNYLYVKAQ